MIAHSKIIHNSHSGRLRPHEHTSYIPLFILLVVVGIVLVGFSISSYVTAAPGPEAGSIGLTGAVPADPPTTAATITSPSNGQRFTTSPIEVAGTCPGETLVQIFKSDIFAGSTPCENGNFSVQIDLLYGQNILTAQVYDSLNQAGPISTGITVFYDAVAASAGPLSLLNFGGAQLLLQTDAVYRGTFPEQKMNVPVNILGGAPAFAINVQWGDSENTVTPRNDNSLFNAAHTYKKPGTYKIIFQASDSKGQVAFLAVAAIINGQPAVLSINNSSNKPLLNKLLVLWPLFAIAVTMVLSFWIGERHEKKMLTRAGELGPQIPAGTTPHLSL